MFILLKNSTMACFLNEEVKLTAYNYFLWGHKENLHFFGQRVLTRLLNYSPTTDPLCKASKDAKIRNRCNQVPHLTQDIIGKVTNSQLDTTNESQEASPFHAGNHKAHINRLAQRHSKHKTEKYTRSTKEVQLNLS